jgi:tetratricopeptide (TPR) repeat protein
MADAHHACDDVSPAEDAAIAAKVLAEGDLAHAALHAARALSGDPSDRQYLALFERIVAAADDPLRIVPFEHGTSFVIVAARAWTMARLGRTTEAIDLLFRVADVQPTVRYLAWAQDWLSDDAKARAVDPDAVSAAVGTWVIHRREAEDDPAGRPALRHGFPVVERLAATHPASVDLRYWAVAARRKLGQLDEALTAARALYADHPTNRAALAVAMVCREKGDIDGAAASFRAALEHDPKDVGVRLDLGDMLCSAGRVDEGLAAYEEALELEPGNDWARPSVYYYRAVHHGDADAAEKLRLMTFNEPGNRRAETLAERLPAGGRSGKPAKKKAAKKKAAKTPKTKTPRGGK